MTDRIRAQSWAKLALTVLATAAALGWAGCGSDAKDAAAGTSAADAKTGGGQDTDAQAADTIPLDSAADSAADGAADGAAADGQLADAGADSTAVSPAEAACAAYAATICAAAPSCCGGTAPSGCSETWVKACLKLGWADADDALLNKQLQLDDAAKTACTQAIQAATQGCDRGAVGRALSLCLRAWVDPAKVGQPCAAPVELSCAAGTGRCTAKTTDLYQCTLAVGESASCSLAQPCLPGLECLDSGLTRAKTCGKPGSTCNLADKCWDGWQCDSGSCKLGPTALPASCTKDEDCPTTHACAAGQCSPKLCK